jgi:hypothetical protein
VILAGGFIPSESFAEDLRRSQFEAVEIVHVFTVVVAESLFVQIAEKMEWFDRNVGAANAALQERPEILKGVGVDVAIHVGYGVVNDLMRILAFEPIVGKQRIGIKRRTRFNVLADLSLAKFSSWC